MLGPEQKQWLINGIKSSNASWGYAIAEFTPDELKWSVYRVNKIAYEKLDDGHGSNVRNVSTNRVQKQPVHSATYQPNGIQLG